MRKLALLACAAIVGACSSTAYQPEAYPIKDESIGKFDVSGEVSVENVQADRGLHTLYGFAPPLFGDYFSITQMLVAQLKKEIDNDGVRLKTGTPKTIKIAVGELATQVRGTSYLTWLDVAVGLGEAPPVMIRAVTTTGTFATLGYHAYDHAIAYAVYDILRHKEVLDYLAQAGASGPKLKTAMFEGAGHAAPAKGAGALAPAGKDATARLTELKNMLDKGLITKEQYDKKRQEILDSM